jgi:YVTN family beta-propeller protein
MKTKPFVLGAALAALATLSVHAATVRIVQTNAAGDSVMLIDPATNKVVGEIKGIEVNHGAAVAPDGSKFYITNEAESTLDVADAKTLAVTKHIPLTNHPNNVAVSKDGKRVYVAIVAGAGAIDVIDTATRDVGGYVDRAKRVVDQQVTLPAGYTLQWTGQYEFQLRARERRAGRHFRIAAKPSHQDYFVNRLSHLRCSSIVLDRPRLALGLCQDPLVLPPHLLLLQCRGTLS